MKSHINQLRVVTKSGAIATKTGAIRDEKLILLILELAAPNELDNLSNGPVLSLGVQF